MFSPACFTILFKDIVRFAYNLQVDIDPKVLALQLQLEVLLSSLFLLASQVRQERLLSHETQLKWHCWHVSLFELSSKYPTVHEHKLSMGFICLCLTTSQVSQLIVSEHVSQVYWQLTQIWSRFPSKYLFWQRHESLTSYRCVIESAQVRQELEIVAHVAQEYTHGKQN